MDEGLQAGLQRMQALFMSGVAAGGGASAGNPSPSFLTAANAVPLGAVHTAVAAQPGQNVSRPKGQGNGRVFEGFPGTKPPQLRGRCPKCLQTGHSIKQCKNMAAVELNPCCNFYGRHRFECVNNPTGLNNKGNGANRGAVNYFSVSSEEDPEQPNLADEDLYPVDVEVGDFECEEDLTGSEDGYTSSEDELGELYLGPRVSKGRRLEKLPPLPRQSLRKPLSAEEKAKRYKTRVSNREERQRKNTRIISLILKDAGPQLAAHRDYVNFRTDLHHYIDELFSHERRNRSEEHPAAARAQVQGSKSATADEERPAKRSRTEVTTPAAAMHLKVDIDPGVDRTNYQTEVTLQIDDAEKTPHRVRAIVDSGATSSGINEKLVERLGLSDQIRPTSYTYRTAGGDVQRARGVVRLTLRMGPISVKTWVLVMARACNFNLLLGNEILTVLQADILRSRNQVRFQYASTVVYLPLLPREQKDGAEAIYRITSADVPDGWVTDNPPEVSVPKNGLRAVARRRRRRTARQ